MVDVGELAVAAQLIENAVSAEPKNRTVQTARGFYNEEREREKLNLFCSRLRNYTEIILKK